MGIFSKKSKTDTGDDPNRSALFGHRKDSPASTAASNGSSNNPYARPSIAPSIAPSLAPSTSPPPYRSNSGYAPSIDSNRDALFAGRSAAPGNEYGSSGSAGRRDVSPSVAAAGYGSNDYDVDRQLTEQEEEQEDVDAVKQEIRFTKQESVASTRNALRIASQAEETGRGTLARLGQQGERLYNTEKNLDMAAAGSRQAEEKARELKTLNGSMFAIHMKNPMRSKVRAAEEEERVLNRHQGERDEREQTRQFGYQSRAVVGQALKGPGEGYTPSVGRQQTAKVVERSKYQFEADDSDDEKEKEIDANLNQLGAVTGRLKGLAMSTSEEVDRQNRQIGKITQKSDRVDDRIVLTHGRIKKIH